MSEHIHDRAAADCAEIHRWEGEGGRALALGWGNPERSAGGSSPFGRGGPDGGAERSSSMSGVGFVEATSPVEGKIPPLS